MSFFVENKGCFTFKDDEDRYITTFVDFILIDDRLYVSLRNNFTFDPSKKHYNTLYLHFKNNIENVYVKESECGYNGFTLYRDFGENQYDEEKENIGHYFNKSEMTKFYEFIDKHST
jgi:hypothetical protein